MRGWRPTRSTTREVAVQEVLARLDDVPSVVDEPQRKVLEHKAKHRAEERRTEQAAKKITELARNLPAPPDRGRAQD